MKQSILAEIAKLQEKQMGYVAALSYQYSQLCVKADPTLLLGIVMEEDGIERKIEDLAQVRIYEEKEKQDRIDLVPRESNDYIPVLAKGVAEFYPEIKQSVETDDPDDDDPQVAEQRKAAQEEYGMELPPSEKSYYLVLTMPEVDDDRKKLLEDAVKVLHDAMKVRMDATFAYHAAQVTAKCIGEAPEDAKAAADRIDAVNKQYEEMRKQLTEEKQKEIQEANELYHQKHIQAEQDSAADDAWKKLSVQ